MISGSETSKESNGASRMVRNAATLVTGTAGAQLIPLFASPVLTRLFSPEEFAVLALFLSLLALAGSVATGRFAFAIVVPRDMKEAVNLLSLSLVFGVGLSLFLLLLVLIFGEHLAVWLGNPAIEPWLLLLPLSTFLSGVIQTFEFYRNRCGQFRSIAYARLHRSGWSTASNIGSGLAGWGAAGLVLSSVLGQLVESAALIHSEWKSIIGLVRQYSTRKGLLEVFRTYFRFLRYSAPSSLLNVLSIQVPVLLLTRFFEKASVGFYFQAHKVLSTPVTIVGNAVAQAFLHDISSFQGQASALAQRTRTTALRMLMLAILPSALIMIFGEELFAFVFGEEWRVAGAYARYLMPWLLLVFIGSPLTMLLEVFHRQRLFMRFNFMLLALRVVAMLAGKYYFDDAAVSIILYSLVSAAMWLILDIFVLLRVSRFTENGF